ncbi:MAG TPA: hypothetical protein VJC03_07885, partial [bacterium]|nr:hypothetical protein [bacterium]
SCLFFHLLKSLLAGVSFYALFAGAGIHLPFWKITLLTHSVILFTLIPISIDGLGIKEGAAVYLYALLLVPEPLTFSVFFMFNIIRYIMLITGLLLIKRKTDG